MTTTDTLPETERATAVVARRRLRRSLLHLILAVVAALYLSPLLYMLVTSFKNSPDAGSTDPQWIPSPATLEAYRTVLGATDSPVLRWLLNSLLAATAHTLLVLVTATPAAYALARMRFRGRTAIFTAVVATLFVPPMVLLIPNFLIVNELAWVDSLPSVIVPGAASAFGVFFLRQFFLTLPAGLATLQNANAVRYDLLMAGAMIAALPVLLLYLVAQRFVIEGVSRTGLKG